MIQIEVGYTRECRNEFTFAPDFDAGKGFFEEGALIKRWFASPEATITLRNMIRAAKIATRENAVPIGDLNVRWPMLARPMTSDCRGCAFLGRSRHDFRRRSARQL